MEISKRTSGGVTLLDLEGDLAPPHGKMELRDAVTELVAAGQASILLNFQNVGFVSSAGIGELVRSFQRVTEAGFTIKIANLQPPVRDLLQLMKLDRMLETFEAEEEAIRSFAA